jgi:two-component system, sporulation sensor kinase A
MHSEAIMHNVDLNLNFPSHAVYFTCDENQMKQVFINFIKNAIDAMPDGGKLVVDIQQTTEHLMIQISDTGPGISEDKLPLLGQPFYSTKEEGTGLGLMVSFKIIEDHDGCVAVSSEINKGTTFVVKFPNELLCND